MDIIPNWHPIFVHFTVALLSVAVILYVSAYVILLYKWRPQLLTVARWNLWLGTAFTVITVLTGWYAYNTVAHDEPSHIAMTDHRNLALMTAALFIALAAWSIRVHRQARTVQYLMLMSLTVALILLGSTAWRGGELVYRYGLGVMSLPDAGVDVDGEHHHTHKDMNQDSSDVNKIDPVQKANDDHAGHTHDH